MIVSVKTFAHFNRECVIGAMKVPSAAEQAAQEEAEELEKQQEKNDQKAEEADGQHFWNQAKKKTWNPSGSFDLYKDIDIYRVFSFKVHE